MLTTPCVIESDEMAESPAAIIQLAVMRADDAEPYSVIRIGGVSNALMPMVLRLATLEHPTIRYSHSNGLQHFFTKIR